MPIGFSAGRGMAAARLPDTRVRQRRRNGLEMPENDRKKRPGAGHATAKMAAESIWRTSVTAKRRLWRHETPFPGPRASRGA